MKLYVSLLFIFLLALQNLNAQSSMKMKDDKVKVKTSASATTRIVFSPLDTLAIERIMKMKGKSNKGEYKITIPQNDLDVTVDGFKIIPAMGLGSWIAFTPTNNGAMIMGDLILTETDLKPVQAEVIRQGLNISAIHNHFVRNHPNVMYMHIGGMGNTESMATKARSVLDKINEVRGGDPSKGSASNGSVDNSIDVKKLDGILHSAGEMSKGVYKYTIGRPDVTLKEHGTSISTFLGFNTWAAFQGTNERAAVAGDFTMLETEVEPVIKALIENGIEVVAVHNHMVHEQPRIFFLHYWGVGNAEQLAKGLRAAIDQTGKGTNRPHLMMQH
ncbi:MAG: DUF1259 domain-containing protein [Candidatus Dadabacteria bacterium]